VGGKSVRQKSIPCPHYQAFRAVSPRERWWVQSLGRNACLKMIK